MNLITHELIINNEKLILTNQRALFWQGNDALVISDLHLGKTAHFRKNGIALPSQLIDEDLKRLSFLLQHFNAKKLIIVGDFLHAGKNSEFEVFKNWKLNFPKLTIILIKGNHDKIADKTLLELGISEVHHTFEENHFLFSHQEIADSPHFIISGHIHPGIQLKLPTKKFLKLPCFIIKKSGLILPAFSSFTGLDTKTIVGDADFYAFSEEGIFKI